MKTVCIVQARTTSERFPMKIFAGLAGRPMLAHVLERAAAIKGVDQVVLAVPENDVRLVSHLWSHVFGGSEKDVLGRYAKAAEQYEADAIVRITGDCWSICPEISSKVLELFMTGQFDYCTCIQPFTTWPDGLDTEVFSRAILDQADKNAKLKDEREHVTKWMQRHLDVRMGHFACDNDYTSWKLSVDCREDLAMANTLLAAMNDTWKFEDLMEAIHAAQAFK